MNGNGMYHKFLSFILLGLITAISAGCQPDLVPERRVGSTGREGFCRRDGDSLVVRIRNQTNFDVFVPTETTVLFSPGGEITESTPPIPGGSMADVSFLIPSGCFDPDCSFTITVDAKNQINESHTDQPDNHETNNVEDGICIG